LEEMTRMKDAVLVQHDVWKKAYEETSRSLSVAREALELITKHEREGVTDGTIEIAKLALSQIEKEKK
jgi:hypothetical protein